MAEVSLRTFYRYYKDKNALLDHMEDKIIDKLKQALDHDCTNEINREQKIDDQVKEIRSVIMNDVLQFAIYHCESTRILLSANGDLALWERIKQVVEEKFKDSFEIIFEGNFVVNNYIQLQLNSYVDSKLVFILNWLDFTDTISVKEAKKLLNSTFSIKL